MLRFDNDAQEAAHYLSLLMGSAESVIDERFGKGYAKENPELVGNFIKAGAIYLGAKISSKSISTLSGSVNDVASAIESSYSISGPDPRGLK
jgi:hypothetical protein